MKWNKTLPVLALSSLLLVSNQVPAHASTAPTPEQLVRSAESYAGSLKWAISIEGTGDGHTIPWNYYNGTKSAYQKALAAVSTLSSGKTKTALQSRLENHVNLYIRTTPGKVGRAVAYIDAINAGQKIEKKKNQLNNRLAASIIDDTTEQYYHDLSYEIKKQAYLLDRVYGVTTRELIRSHFKGTAEQAKSNALYPVSIHMALDELQSDLDSKYYIHAIPFQAEIDALFKDAKEKSLITQAVYDKLHARYEQQQKLLPTLVDFTFTDVEGKYSQVNNFEYTREFKLKPEIVNSFDTFSFRLYEEAATVKVSLLTGNIMETVFTGDNLSSGEINLNDFKAKHAITDLKDLTFTFTVTDKKGQTKVETGKLIGEVPFVFTDGTYHSDYGYSLDIPRAYELRIGDNGYELVNLPHEEAAENWLSVQKLSPTSDLAKVRQNAVEFLQSAGAGQPKDFDGYNYFAGTDIEVKLHLIVRSINFSEEILVVKVDNQLVQFTDHIDNTNIYLEVSGEFTNIMKSINFN